MILPPRSESSIVKVMKSSRIPTRKVEFGLPGAYNLTIMGAQIRELTAGHRAVCLRHVECPATPLSEIAEAFGYSYGRTSQILNSRPAKKYMRELEERMVTETIRKAALMPELPGFYDEEPITK